MPRLKYTGPYRPEMVPFHPAPERNQTLSGYGKLPEPKALAIAPSPPRVKVGSGPTAAEAAADALQACNQEPGFNGAYPCFLYAINNDVVISQRRTE